MNKIIEEVRDFCDKSDDNVKSSEIKEFVDSICDRYSMEEIEEANQLSFDDQSLTAEETTTISILTITKVNKETSSKIHELDNLIDKSAPGDFADVFKETIKNSYIADSVSLLIIAMMHVMAFVIMILLIGRM